EKLIAKTVPKILISSSVIIDTRLKTAYGLIAAMPGVPCVFYGDEVGMEGYRDPFCRRTFPWHNMDKDLLTYYRTIGNIRREEPVLKTGVLQILAAEKDYAFFARTPWNGEDHQILVAVNRSEKALTLTTPADVWELVTDTPWQSGENRLAAGQVVYLRCRADISPETFVITK
ncbi:MAG: DUF3459 domain-containing protein, partial [Clostridia bacterium]|nr:DUF3459 domain-containing protein [Clostridia bacterium]